MPGVSTGREIQQPLETGGVVSIPSSISPVSEEEAKRPVPVQELASRNSIPSAKSSPDSSLQPHYVRYLGKLQGQPLLIVLTLFVTLLLSVSVGMNLWLYTAPHATTGTPHSTASTVSQSTPTTIFAPGAYPKLAGAYSGTLHDIPTNKTANIALTAISQRQGIINGYFGGLDGNRLFNRFPQHTPFTGTITTTRHMQFIVIDDTGQASFSFDGLLQPEGIIAGTYCSVEIVTGKCSDYGVWSISPLQS